METAVRTNVEFTFIQLTEFLVSEIWVIYLNEEKYGGEVIISMN